MTRVYKRKRGTMPPVKDVEKDKETTVDTARMNEVRAKKDRGEKLTTEEENILKSSPVSAEQEKIRQARLKQDKGEELTVEEKTLLALNPIVRTAAPDKVIGPSDNEFVGLPPEEVKKRIEERDKMKKEGKVVLYLDRQSSMRTKLVTLFKDKGMDSQQQEQALKELELIVWGE